MVKIIKYGIYLLAFVLTWPLACHYICNMNAIVSCSTLCFPDEMTSSALTSLLTGLGYKFQVTLVLSKGRRGAKVEEV